MNYKNLMLMILFGYIFSLSCSPVRNTTVRNAKSNNSDGAIATNLAKPKPRFQDTTLIKLPDVVPDKDIISNGLSDSFKDAINDFENKKYDEACQKFSSIQSTLNDSDSLYFEADFYISECLVVRNQLDNAKKSFEVMLTDKRLPQGVLEKVLVRLGQIYCAKNDKKSAAKYFSRLTDVNPYSIYIKVANCEFLNQGAK